MEVASDAYKAAKRQGIYTPLATNTEVNNCFSIFKNIEIIEHKKRWFLTHLLPTIQTILARKWPNGRRVFLLTNKTFEGILLANVGKFLQKLWILFVFEAIL